MLAIKEIVYIASPCDKDHARIDFLSTNSGVVRGLRAKFRIDDSNCQGCRWVGFFANNCEEFTDGLHTLVQMPEGRCVLRHFKVINS